MIEKYLIAAEGCLAASVGLQTASDALEDVDLVMAEKLLTMAQMNAELANTFIAAVKILTHAHGSND